MPKERIEKLILCGIPVNDLNESEMDNCAKLSCYNPEDVLVFQNDKDNHGSFLEVAKLFNKLNLKMRIEKKHRSDHEYPSYGEFMKFPILSEA